MKPKGTVSPHEAGRNSDVRLDKDVAYAILANTLRELPRPPELQGRSWVGLISDVTCISEESVRTYASKGRRKLEARDDG